MITVLNLSRRSQGKLDMVAFWKEIAQKVIPPRSRLMFSDVITHVITHRHLTIRELLG
jgi:hypothetical protein